MTAGDILAPPTPERAIERPFTGQANLLAPSGRATRSDRDLAVHPGGDLIRTGGGLDFGEREAQKRRGFLPQTRPLRRHRLLGNRDRQQRDKQRDEGCESAQKHQYQQ
jgi:hypothetical protein